MCTVTASFGNSSICKPPGSIRSPEQSTYVKAATTTTVTGFQLQLHGMGLSAHVIRGPAGRGVAQVAMLASRYYVPTLIRC